MSNNLLDRVKETLRKAESLVSQTTDVDKKKQMESALLVAQTAVNVIETNNIACPPHLAQHLEDALAVIEKLYEEKVLSVN